MQLIKPIGSFLAHTAFINSQRDCGYRPQGHWRMVEPSTPPHFLTTKPKISVIHELSEHESIPQRKSQCQSQSHRESQPESDCTNLALTNTEKADKLESLLDDLDNYDLNLPDLGPTSINTALKSPLSRRQNPGVIGGPGPLSPTDGHSDHYYNFQNQNQNRIDPLEGLQETLKIDKNEKNEVKNLKNKIMELQNALMVKTMELKMAQNSKKSKSNTANNNHLEIRMNLQTSQEKFLEKCKYMKKKLTNGVPLTFTIKMNGDPENHLLASQGILKMAKSYLREVSTIDENYKTFEDSISVSIRPRGMASDPRPGSYSESLRFPDSPTPNDHSTNPLSPPSSIYSESFTDFSQSLDSATASHANSQSNNLHYNPYLDPNSPNGFESNNYVNNTNHQNNIKSTSYDNWQSNQHMYTPAYNWQSNNYVNNTNHQHILQHNNSTPTTLNKFEQPGTTSTITPNTTHYINNHNTHQYINPNVGNHGLSPNFGINNNTVNPNIGIVNKDNKNVINNNLTTANNNQNKDNSSTSRWITKNKQNPLGTVNPKPPPNVNPIKSTTNSTSNQLTQSSDPSSSGKWKVLNKR